MTDIICPLCGKPNPPELDECKYCQAPLKSAGFIAPAGGEDELTELIAPAPQAGESKPKDSIPADSSNLENAIPDWLKDTEASFLDQSDFQQPESSGGELTSDQISEQIDSLLKPPASAPEQKENKIDDDWLASLLAEAGVGESEQPLPSSEQPEEQAHEEVEPEPEVPESGQPEEEQAMPTSDAEKPEWLTSLEASSKIKLAGGIQQAEQEIIETPLEEPGEEKAQEPSTPPDWLAKAVFEDTSKGPDESESQLASAELPGWLEALRPTESALPTEPTGPVEDVSNADVVTSGPLSGLRGVISPQSAAIRARKPPTYSIKLRVTDEQRARVEMMEALLADEEKATPLPAQPIITSRNIFRLVVVLCLLLPIIWMIVSGSQNVSLPQSGNFPGLIDFTQQIQTLPEGAPVMVAFDYEAGFSGELNLAITNVISQLMKKNAYLTLVATNPSGPALGESTIKTVYSSLAGNTPTYAYYANLGYVPGGTLGLLGLANAPKSTLPYALNGDNVWAGVPLNTISTIKDFSAVLVLTNDTDTARSWIEQVGPMLREANRPLLFVASAQAQPLILPYYEATPAQVQGLLSGLAGGVAYARSMGNIQQNGVWDAYSIGITVSALIILVGSIVSGVVKTVPPSKKKEG